MHHHKVDHHKPSSQLHVVAVVSNPVRFESRYRLFKNFQRYMATQDVNLITVEMAYGDRDFVVTEKGSPNHVQVRAKSELWHKESLINRGFQALPDDWQYAAWIDGDVQFHNLNWVHDALQALQHHKVVQLFQDCIDLGPQGEVMQSHRSFGFQFATGQPMRAAAYGGGSVVFPHPGFAWAIRREAFEGIGGLVDFAILGAADHHMAWAFAGGVEKSVPRGLSSSYLDKLMAFESRCDHFVQRDLGYVPGTISHFWHGKKKDRRYVERWSVLIDHKFDPDLDLKRNHHGIWELDGRNHGLRDAIRTYMRQRNEDSIDLE